MALFRTDYSGRGELSERQQKVEFQVHNNWAHKYVSEQIVSLLKCCQGWRSWVRNIMSVYYPSFKLKTNEAFRSLSSWQTKYNVGCSTSIRGSLLMEYRPFMSADPGATMTFVAGGALKPIGGHILSHASATRMFLRKGDCHVFYR